MDLSFKEGFIHSVPSVIYAVGYFCCHSAKFQPECGMSLFVELVPVDSKTVLQ